MARGETFEQRKRRFRQIQSPYVASYGPCADLLRKLAPFDTAKASIYVVVDDGQLLAGNCMGSYCSWFSELFREGLLAKREWRGPGFACCVSSKLDELQTLTTVCHEFAHWLADNSLLSKMPQRDAMAIALRNDGDPDASRRHHGPRFARAVSHMAWRVQRHVHPGIKASQLWQPSQYGYSCSADEVLLSLAFELGCDSIRDQLDEPEHRDFTQVTARVSGAVGVGSSAGGTPLSG